LKSVRYVSQRRTAECRCSGSASYDRPTKRDVTTKTGNATSNVATENRTPSQCRPGRPRSIASGHCHSMSANRIAPAWKQTRYSATNRSRYRNASRAETPTRRRGTGRPSPASCQPASSESISSSGQWASRSAARSCSRLTPRDSASRTNVCRSRFMVVILPPGGGRAPA
jgi:hypothetical protein